ncbi:phenylacetaldehyde dehydrogenase [Klebsiella pneumoniae]|uniref:Phenylacetaldehyde dehydrogenase n=1 Tax=Klebsiella pneumoniae TaxID=573 RepID=A0A377TTR8_KLEPN|nr:phenylacetaldehyde dehydrogenase [Klebsiella pneumoniae]
MVAGIVPWNFPLMIGMWKVMPALAAGCSIVIKPSETTPLTLLRVAELATQAGIPDGVFNVVTGSGAGCGAALTAHPQVAKVSFTGSTATGKQIARVAADRLTRVTLELGGKNPAIVLKDADPQWVIEGLMTGSFLNQGQVCAASSRIYIEAPLFDTLVSGFEQAVKSLQVGRGCRRRRRSTRWSPGPTATRWRPTSKRLASRRQSLSAAAPDQTREGTIFRQRWW